MNVPVSRAISKYKERTPFLKALSAYEATMPSIETYARINKAVDAWWPLANKHFQISKEGRPIPPLTEREWKERVKKDIKAILKKI